MSCITETERWRRVCVIVIASHFYHRYTFIKIHLKNKKTSDRKQEEQLAVLESTRYCFVVVVVVVFILSQMVIVFRSSGIRHDTSDLY